MNGNVSNDYHVVFISATIMGIVTAGLTLGMSRKTIPPRVKVAAAAGD